MGKFRISILVLALGFSVGCIETEKSSDDDGKLSSIPISVFNSMSVDSTGGGFFSEQIAAYRAELDFDTGDISVTEYSTNERLYQCSLDSNAMALVRELLTHKIYYRIFSPNEPIACPGLINAIGFHNDQESASMHFCGDGYYYDDPMATGQLLNQIIRAIEAACLPSSS